MTCQGGQLFYLIGASGSGKDSLMRYARETLAGHQPFIFAHRYITRPVEIVGENHIALTESEFRNRQQAGCFAMHWASHGLFYGIGIEIASWQQAGLDVIVNGSRAYLPEAISRYPDLIPIWIQVSPDILAQRLRKRGRESEAEIQRRLQRASDVRVPDYPALQHVHNDTDLVTAGERLCQILMQYKGCV